MSSSNVVKKNSRLSGWPLPRLARGTCGSEASRPGIYSRINHGIETILALLLVGSATWLLSQTLASQPHATLAVPSTAASRMAGAWLSFQARDGGSHLPLAGLPLVWLAGVLSSVGVRGLWSAVSPASGVRPRRVLLVGGTTTAARFLDGARREHEQFRNEAVELVGMLDDDEGFSQEGFHGVPWLGKLDRLPSLAQETGVDTIVVAVPRATDSRVHELLDRIALDRIEIHVALDAGPYPLATQPYGRIGDAVTLKLRPLGLTPAQAAIKRASDIVLALGFLLALSPLLLACALAVKLGSAGPIFFRQQRRGYRGKSFKLLKFRSFYHNAADLGAVRQTERGDPRIAPVGVFLRKHSLDELPQLLNVLLGDMSIVGPRPHAMKMALEGRRLEEIMPSYEARHRVKPGITGWAQVNGWRGNVDSLAKLVGRVEHDIEYIRNWSLLLDIRIMLRTVGCVLHDPSAF